MEKETYLILFWRVGLGGTDIIDLFEIYYIRKDRLETYLSLDALCISIQTYTFSQNQFNFKVQIPLSFFYIRRILQILSNSVNISTLFLKRIMNVRHKHLLAEFSRSNVILTFKISMMRRTMYAATLYWNIFIEKVIKPL